MLMPLNQSGTEAERQADRQTKCAEETTKTNKDVPVYSGRANLVQCQCG